MRNNKGFRKLGVDSEHRRALLRNLTMQLLLRDRIVTTTAKAKELRRFVDPLVTFAKRGTPHSYNMAKRDLFLDHLVLPHLFGVLAQRYKDRAGGYCRLIRLGPNKRSEEESLVEMVDSPDGYASAYRKQCLDVYKEQFDRVRHAFPAVFSQFEDLPPFSTTNKQMHKPFMHVFPGVKRLAQMKDDPEGNVAKMAVKKLKEIIDRHEERLAPSKITYYSDVELTKDGPIYSGEVIEAPKALLLQYDLSKTKVVYNELNTHGTSKQIQKRAILVERKVNKICKDNKDPELRAKVRQSMREKLNYSARTIAVKVVERTELVPKGSAQSAKQPGHNKHLR